ncbi:MAG: peptidyl-prolyl cis-trans isomerase [Opitutaceae bacterium]|nr:peptidyl-prolyl cis-trans isomerase [Opitutaceae bacterium]
MISWIQRSFQHHFRLVFLIMLVAMAVPLIWVFNASSGVGRAGPKILKQQFFGHDLTKPGTSELLFGDASLSVQLQAGFPAFNSIDSAQLQQYGLQRVAALALADQLKIPEPTKDDIAGFIKGLAAFAGPDGQFDASRYAAFRDNLRTNPRVSEGDIARVLSDDTRITRLEELLGGPGYVLPGEIRHQLARSDSAWDIAVATVDYAAFKPEISAGDDALKRFFEDNAFRYDVPPRVAVDYIEFRTADFMGAVTLNDNEVRAYYDENSARFPRPEQKVTGDDKKPEAALQHNPDADFAAVRPQVEQALRVERAQRRAAKAAADLTVVIYEQRLKPLTPAFEEFLAQGKFTLRSVAPFYRETVPPDLGWTPQVVEQALRLTADHPVSDALPTVTGSLVLFWHDTLPSYRPEFVQVRERVATDYKENERRKRFVEFGRTVRSQLEGRLKAGDPFDQASATIEPKLETKTYPPFLYRQPPQAIDVTVYRALERLGRGQVSDMLLSEDKGYFIYVKDRKLPDLTETNPQYAATRAQLARLDAGLSQGLYLRELVAQELKKSRPVDASR